MGPSEWAVEAWMLRSAGDQVESLLDELLPVEVRELPAELAVREVSDSLHLRRFCLLPLTQRVPDESTVRKLVRRLGAERAGEKDPGPVDR